MSFCTYFRIPKRTVVARGRPGVPMNRVIAAALHLQLCQSLGHCGSMLQMPLVVHVWAMELRVAGVIQ